MITNRTVSTVQLNLTNLLEVVELGDLVIEILVGRIFLLLLLTLDHLLLELFAFCIHLVHQRGQETLRISAERITSSSNRKIL